MLGRENRAERMGGGAGGLRVRLQNSRPVKELLTERFVLDGFWGDCSAKE